MPSGGSDEGKLPVRCRHLRRDATYERKRWPIDPPSAVDAILYRMETAGYTQGDLARLLGSRSRASEVLSRKRPLTLAMIRKLSREWNIPADCLIDVEDRAAA